MLKGQIAVTAVRPTAPVTGSGDTVPPTAPGNLRVTAVSDTSVTLAWSVSTDNVGVAGYRIRRFVGGTATPIGTVAASVTTFTVTGLAASSSYTFDVQALDTAGGVSMPSSQVTTTTSAGGSSTVNVALDRPVTASSYTQSYVPGNAVDGNVDTYWESANSTFPQWLQVDLGSAMGVGRVVLTLPPAVAWAARSQTVSVQGSIDGASFGLLLGSVACAFDPASGNTAALTLPAGTATRHVRLVFTANTGWPAGQVSEFRVFGAA
ncbi:discoidin domain-containing protein [Streptomyces sp. NPDC002131]|uniref:discoidin domain-containing protein n=1 Tax=Streptomyces sp. NPDC002131 TaxID=3154535 RepID=UPI00331D3764